MAALSTPVRASPQSLPFALVPTNTHLHKGDDPFWEAVDIWYSPTVDQEWYDPSQLTTRNGSLVITMDSDTTLQPGLTKGALAFAPVSAFLPRSPPILCLPCTNRSNSRRLHSPLHMANEPQYVLPLWDAAVMEQVLSQAGTLKLVWCSQDRGRMRKAT
jgi:Beta-glucan synthesis-associated protein (SKN1).